jgi:hypothetical protein
MNDLLPYEAELEKQLLGWMLLPGAFQLDRVIGRIEPEDFYNPTNAKIFAAISDLYAAGEQVNHLALPPEIHSADIDAVFAASDIATPERVIGRIVDVANTRDVTRALHRGLSGLAEGSETAEVAKSTSEALTASVHRSSGDPTAVSVGEILEWTDKTAPWLLDGMMRRGHRAMIVAGEGMGKSFLLRQIGLKAAAGLHPFRTGVLLKNGPVKVLNVDLENSKDQILTATRWITGGIKAELPEIDVNGLPFWSANWPERIDIRSRGGRARLERELRAHRPELLIFGPMYRSFLKSGRESDEEVAGEVTQILDDFRARYELTVIMENHAPHSAGQGKRTMRPVGSSLWLRWPEFGFGLQAENTKDGEPRKFKLERWRGDRVASQWPEFLEWSKRYPWQGVYATGTLRGHEETQAQIDF